MMDKQREEIFHQKFDRLLDALASEGTPDMNQVNGIIAEMCEFFRLAKAQTEFFRSMSHERMRDGDLIIGFDNGKAQKIAYQRRVLTKTSAVVSCTAFMEEGEKPLTEDEAAKVDLVMRSIMTFVSRRRLQYAIERMVYHDDQGYPNLRSYFRFWDFAAREGELSDYTALIFNLRHFTLVNREIGREKGDKVMRNFVTMLNGAIGEKGTVCRLGGDNFLAALPNERLDEVLTLLGGAAVSYDDLNDKKIKVAASVGVFPVPKGFHMVSSGEIMDKLMPMTAVAKASGGIVYYSDDMILQRSKHMQMQRLFQQALANEEFQVFYQPKVNIETGEIVGAEALSRWFREGRLIPPIEFIPVMEQSMDICQLDFYVLDHVCRDIYRWLEQGWNVVPISVNFSRKHMMDPEFLTHVLRIVNERQVPHELIEVELTETTTDVEFKDLKQVVRGLQDEGIRTSVDDFGMGYSSLNLIREIPWDVLKIDKSFVPVDGDDLDETTKRMYKHVVSMSMDLEMECVTEGIETKQQVEFLRESGCVIAQGFYYDKPLPVGEFEGRLQKKFYEKMD